MLTFQNPLTTEAMADNPILSGYECAGWTCTGASNIRTVETGYAAAPEAPTWAMMIVGAGLLAGQFKFVGARQAGSAASDRPAGAARIQRPRRKLGSAISARGMGALARVQLKAL